MHISFSISQETLSDLEGRWAVDRETAGGVCVCVCVRMCVNHKALYCGFILFALCTLMNGSYFYSLLKWSFDGYLGCTMY